MLFKPKPSKLCIMFWYVTSIILMEYLWWVLNDFKWKIMQLSHLFVSLKACIRSHMLFMFQWCSPPTLAHVWRIQVSTCTKVAPCSRGNGFLISAPFDFLLAFSYSLLLVLKSQLQEWNLNIKYIFRNCKKKLYIYIYIYNICLHVGVCLYVGVGVGIRYNENQPTTPTVWIYNKSTNVLWKYIFFSFERQKIRKEGRKEMLYLLMHSTHFIYGYMASDIL